MSNSSLRIKKYSQLSQKEIQKSFCEIMQYLVDNGYCPNLINSDNGYWAICTSGIQPAISGGKKPKGDFEVINIISSKQWEKTPEKALKSFLKKVSKNS